MMRVPVRIKPSEVEGLGIFAARKILKGELVMEYDETLDYRMSIEATHSLSDAMTKFKERYAFNPPGTDYYEFNGDAELFCNHSNTPNVVGVGGGKMIAAMDIMEDEELFNNYYEFDTDPNSGGELH